MKIKKIKPIILIEALFDFFISLFIRSTTKQRMVSRILKKTIAAIILSFIFVSFANSIFSINKLKSNAMLETFSKGKYVFSYNLKYAITIKPFVSKLTGHTITFNTPKRGDIVLIKDPSSQEDKFFKSVQNNLISFFTLGIVNKSGSKYLVKRIIALPNEAIAIKDKVVYINDEPINEPWLKVFYDSRILPAEISSRDNFPAVILGYNEYFVLSDNRDYGYDSRDFGVLHFSHIVGKVITK